MLNIVVLVFEFIQTQTRGKVHKCAVNRNNYRYFFTLSNFCAHFFSMRSSALRLEKQMKTGIMAALKCGTTSFDIVFRKRFHSHKKDANHVPLFQVLPDAQ